ncbi:Scr1 family TA system antitoxin-like transcriptional regulator [Streptomyces sp. S816]|uniref:Scr1 family TA system antitoxin-like transcriptional regulator n=1 Tax=Streptomyces sp. S816 TaxID=2283197 RepID=UPI002493240A|nr:Scr1 family TA system antitoxin-like transcriptional regulator [Streptomyces sp. S816]
MGLLQTPEYAAAVMRASFPRETEDQIKERVELRMRRQAVLERDDPPFSGSSCMRPSCGRPLGEPPSWWARLITSWCSCSRPT